MLGFVVCRPFMFLALVTSLGCVACVSLDKPKQVAACSASMNCINATGGSSFQSGGSGSGGTVTSSGGVTVPSTGGNPAGGETGGTTTPLTGGSMIVSGGTIASGGIVSSGGTKPDASVDVGAGGDGSATGGVVLNTGGVTGTGGATKDAGMDVTVPDVSTNTGGITSTGGVPTYKCSSPVVPADGLVTDFTKWNATTSTWTSGSLTGDVYPYKGTNATTTVKVEGTPAGLHITGSIPSNTYGGAGLTIYSCLTLASFTKISFDVYGIATGCAIELQLQTYDQRPADLVPPGTCKNDGGTCYNFPKKSQVVSLTNTVAAPGNTVSTTLSTMTNWTAAAETQIVGIQWQFTSSGGTCTPNATFTNIKFVP